MKGEESEGLPIDYLAFKVTLTDVNSNHRQKRELRSLYVIPEEIILETWARQNKGTPRAS